MEQVQIKHKVKRFGILSNIFAATSAVGVVFLLFWLKRMHFGAGGILIYMIGSVCPVIVIRGEELTVHFVNPFKKKVTLSLSEINKVEVHMNMHSEIKFFTATEVYKTSFLKNYSLAKDLYYYFILRGLNVESTGPGATGLNP